MMRYWRFLNCFFGNALQIELEYRVDSFVNALSSCLSFGAGLIVLQAIFQQVPELGGWSFEQGLVLFGVFLMLDSYTALILYPNLNRLPEYVRTGALDFILLKPISSQFLVSVRFINIWALPNAALGIAVVLYGMARLGTLSPASICLTLLMLIPACAIIYGVWCMMTTTAFWWVKVENVTSLFRMIFEAGRFPVTAYPPWLQIGLTFVIPVAFLTTVPAGAAVGALDNDMALAGWLAAGICLTASHAFWQFAIRSYTSASS